MTGVLVIGKAGRSWDGRGGLVSGAGQAIRTRVMVIMGGQGG